MKFCNNCGTAITEDNQKFCPGCGANIEAQDNAQAQYAQQSQQPVAAPVYEAAPAAAVATLPVKWNDALSKYLMKIAAVVLIILGILMWTGGIYQHVIFRMSDEGKMIRPAISLIQGEYNGFIEEPEGLIDEMNWYPAIREGFEEGFNSAIADEIGGQVPGMNIGGMINGKVIADAIDEADLSITSDYLYEQYGLMQFVDIIFGVIMIALGLFAYTVGQNLSQYKRDAVKMFDTYNIAVLGAVVIYGVLYNFVLSPFSDIFEIFTLPYFVIVLLLVASLFYNREYYAKRQHMFVY